MAVPVVKASPLLHDYIHNITSSIAPPVLAVFLCGLLWDRASEEVTLLRDMVSGEETLLIGRAREEVTLLRDRACEEVTT